MKIENTLQRPVLSPYLNLLGQSHCFVRTLNKVDAYYYDQKLEMKKHNSHTKKFHKCDLPFSIKT